MTNLLRYAAMLLCLACMPIFTQAQCTVNAGVDVGKCNYVMDSIQLFGSVTGNFTTYSWTSTGNGVFQNTTTLNPYYFPTTADYSKDSIIITLTATGGSCGTMSDVKKVSLYKRPTVVLQNEFTVCGSQIPLTSTVTGAANLQWYTMVGTGTFSSSTSPNPTYTASAADITRGYVMVRLKASTIYTGCAHEDTVKVNIGSTATVDAGADKTICATQGTQTYCTGSGTGFTTYVWSTSGTGTFSSPTSLASVYNFSAADIAAGSVTLTLTGSSSTCSQLSDALVINLLQTPSVNAGPDQNVCGNTVALNGTVSPTSGVTVKWTSPFGSGSFNNTNILAPVYTFSAADVTQGYVFLDLQATSTNGCVFDDTIKVYTDATASIDAGADQTICSNAIYLNGTVTGSYTSYAWTSSGSGTFANPLILTAPYYFSAADIVAGSVTLTLTGTSSCGTVSDELVVAIATTPTVNAGVEQSVCGTTVALNGTVNPSSGVTVQWVADLGTGTFSNTTTKATVYTASAADLTKGFALITLFATTSAGCMAVDTVRLDFNKTPEVFAGAYQLSCSNTVNVHGYAAYATSKTWTSSGTGSFVNTTKDSTIYTASIADIAAGKVVLTYTGVNACGTASSNTEVLFLTSTAVSVNAGLDVTVCGRDTVQLAGTVSNVSGGSWSTNGSGYFIYSPSHLANLYVLSTADKASGSVTFTLTSYGNGGCNPVSDTKVVTIPAGSLPNVYAGPDQVSSISTSLNASVSNAVSQLWETSGTGLFAPSPTALNASYIPSVQDIAAGSVVLTLVATGTCGEASDALTLYTAIPCAITGKIKAGANTLDRGFVYLFVKSQGMLKLVGIDSLKPSDNGAYEFPSVASGSYLMFAVPSTASAYSTTYLATYYGNLNPISWSDAQSIEIVNGSASQTLNLNLASFVSAKPNWNTGKDTISGTIFYNIALPAMRLADETGNSLADAVVYLKTVEGGHIIAYTKTDKYGAYSFNNIVSGNYLVATEYASAFYMNQKTVPVDGNSKTVEDGSNRVDLIGISTGILTPNKSTQVQAYPNPATENVHVKLPAAGNYSVKVFDETGVVKHVQQLIISSGETADISLGSLNKGLYIIQITSGDEVYNAKVVKF